MAKMKVEILTAERTVYSDEADLVVAPGMEGELGILPHHAPLLTVLRPGELRIVKEGEEEFLAISGGFLEVVGDKVTILADAAERSDEIDIARAQMAMKRAQERLQQRAADIDLERALAALQRSQARIKVAQRKRRPPGQPEQSSS